MLARAIRIRREIGWRSGWNRDHKRNEDEKKRERNGRKKDGRIATKKKDKRKERLLLHVEGKGRKEKEELEIYGTIRAEGGRRTNR